MAQRLNPEALASQILMRSNARDLKRVIVEGHSDRVLFERLLPLFAGKHRVEVAHGRPAALGVLAVLRRRRSGGVKVPAFIAVVDADFDCLIDELSPDPDAIVTDAHDAEAMMIRTSAFERALEHLLSPDRHPQLHAALDDGLREHLLDAGCAIGWYRLASLDRQLQLHFRSIDYRCVLDDSGRIRAEAEIAAELVRCSRNARIGLAHLVSLTEQTRSQYQRRARESGRRNVDPWHLSSGHDLTALAVEQLAIRFGGERAVSQKGLERQLRQHYGHEEFSRTETGRRLIDWARDADRRTKNR